MAAFVASLQNVLIKELIWAQLPLAFERAKLSVLPQDSHPAESLSFPVNVCLEQFHFEVEQIQQRKKKRPKGGLEKCPFEKECRYPNSLSERDRNELGGFQYVGLVP